MPPCTDFKNAPGLYRVLYFVSETLNKTRVAQTLDTANMIVELADLADPYIPVGSAFEESIAVIFTCFYTKFTGAKMQEVSAKLLENKMLESMRVLVSFIACFLQTTFSQKYIYLINIINITILF